MLDLIKTIAQFIPKYIATIVKILQGPKRYINEKNKLDDNLQHSLVFFAISFCLAFLLTPEFFLPQGDIIQALGIRLILSIVFTLFGAASIFGAWKIVGAQASYLHFLTTYLYISGVLAVLLSFVNCLSFGAAMTLDADTTQRWIQLNMELLSSDYTSLMNQLESTTSESKEIQELIKLRNKPAVLVVIYIAHIGFLLCFAWFVICWGAFREITNLSKTRSFIAFILSLFLIILVLFVRGLFSTAMGIAL